MIATRFMDSYRWIITKVDLYCSTFSSLVVIFFFGNVKFSRNHRFDMPIFKEIIVLELKFWELG
jgi:hypothetical protein